MEEFYLVHPRIGGPLTETQRTALDELIRSLKTFRTWDEAYQCYRFGEGTFYTMHFVAEGLLMQIYAPDAELAQDVLRVVEKGRELGLVFCGDDPPRDEWPWDEVYEFWTPKGSD